MKQMTLAKTQRPLLTYAISKLSPEVFTHPVWVRFWGKNRTIPPEGIQNLYEQAKDLQRNSPSEACQILLLCAVYQNYSGQRPNALRTIQTTIDLAEGNRLHRELLWVLWGACAVCVQKGDYEQAVSYFDRLQAALHEQNEWMLADYVEEVKQMLGHGAISSAEGHPQSDDLVDLTFLWLQNWGSSVPFLDGIHTNVSSAALFSSRPFFSIQRWQAFCQMARMIFQGRLKLRWVESDKYSEKQRPFLRESIPIPLPSGAPNSKIEEIENVPRLTNVPILPRPEETSLTRATGQSSDVKKTQRRRQPERANDLIPISVHMLGAFVLTVGDMTVKLPLSRGLSLLKYLLLHHKQNIPREVLMDVFWPEADPETARNDLNVTMHSLRKALRNVIFLPVVVFAEGTYGLEANIQVWLDVEEFEKCIKAGQRSESRNQMANAIAAYESAISLYQGDFLEETPYEEWTVLERERLRIAYLDTLDRLSQIYFIQEHYAACITVCQLILTRDRCREDTHCLLMKCYSRQGQYHLALRQYQNCVEALRAELQVEPAPETTRLYNRIRRREPI